MTLNECFIWPHSKLLCSDPQHPSRPCFCEAHYLPTFIVTLCAVGGSFA
jgi:hypothetical protein